jgi:hypothetical protein
VDSVPGRYRSLPSVFDVMRDGYGITGKWSATTTLVLLLDHGRARVISASTRLSKDGGFPLSKSVPRSTRGSTESEGYDSRRRSYWASSRPSKPTRLIPVLRQPSDPYRPLARSLSAADQSRELEYPSALMRVPALNSLLPIPWPHRAGPTTRLDRCPISSIGFSVRGSRSGSPADPDDRAVSQSDDRPLITTAQPATPV